MHHNLCLGVQSLRWNSDDPAVVFHGRNGTGRCRGLEILASLRSIDFQPITSRGRPGNCHIAFPPEILPELIQVLQKLRRRHYAARLRRLQRLRQPPPPPDPRCGAPCCPGCVNCGRGQSNR